MNHPLATLVLALGMMTALWPLSIRLRDVSIVDIFWAPGFAVVAWSYDFLGPISGSRAWIVLGLVSTWALRLGSHLLVRWQRLATRTIVMLQSVAGMAPNFPSRAFCRSSGFKRSCSG